MPAGPGPAEPGHPPSLAARYACRFFAVAMVCAACKEHGAAPDASVQVETLEDEELGLSLSVPSSWERAEAAPSTAPASLPASERVLIEARRRARSGRRFAVVPRLNLIARSADPEIGVDALIDRVVDDLRAALPEAQARLRRTTTGKRFVDGVEVGQIELDYTVIDPTGGPGRDVVQRSLVAIRHDRAGEPFAVELTLSYLSEDEEALGTEVDRVLRSLHFREQKEARLRAVSGEE